VPGLIFGFHKILSCCKTPGPEQIKQVSTGEKAREPRYL
jgi:hypothetical protein